MKKLTSILTAGLIGAVALTSSAFALGQQGVLLGSADLPAASRAALMSAVSADQAEHPDLYQTVAKLRGCTPAGYADRRRPMAECGREMRLLGPQGRWALVSALVFEAPRSSDGRQPYVSASDKAAFIRGAIETLGMLRDPALSPVLQTAFLRGEAQFYEVSAQALGRTATAADEALLTQHAWQAGPRQLAAVSGLGECKRLSSAQTLVKLLETAGAPADKVANALGRVASAWAWQALVRSGAGRAEDAERVRGIVAMALVRGLVQYGDAAAVKQLTDGLLMTEWPQVPALLDSVAAGKASDVQARLAEAKRRFVDYSKR